jgi:hypothetical protein
MPSLKQVSFSAGLIAPQLLGRSDQQKFTAGLRTCTNAMITRFGGVQNRPGTQYTDDLTLISGGNPSRLISFVFNYANAYQLVFSTGNIRVYKNNVQVTKAYSAMSAWSNATAYLVGNIVSYSGGAWICVTANTNQAPSGMSSYWEAMVEQGSSGNYYVDIPVSGATVNLLEESLQTLQAVQLNDIMTVTSQLFYPFQLTRFDDADWTVTPFTVTASIAAPTGVALAIGVAPTGGPAAPTGLAASGGTGGGGTGYYVTAFEFLEGVVSNLATVTGAPTSGSPVSLSWTAPGGTIQGYIVYRGDMTGAHAGIIAVLPNTATSYSDTGADPSAFVVHPAPVGNIPGTTTFTYVVTAVSAANGAESLASSQVTGVGNTPTPQNPNVISWSPVTGASIYNVYSIVNGIPGLVGATTLLYFYDINIQPDTSQQPPVNIPLFSTSNDWPAVCAYFQERLLFANTINQPQTVWGSRVGTYTDFAVSTPVEDSDAFQFVVANTQSQPINALVDLGKLIIHTASAEFICTGNQLSALTPTAINPVIQGYSGAQLLRPVVIGNTDIFIQARGNQIRDLRFEIQSYQYTGKDLTVFASNLFIGQSIIDMAWQNIHDSIVWVVTASGLLYGLTYVREHDIWAWHQHTFTNGFVEAVCVVPNGQQDVVSVIIRRVINGQTVRYLERLANRDLLDTVLYTDAIFVDSALQYDGRNTTGTTVTTSTSATWTPEDTITLTATASVFTSGMDGSTAVVLQQIDAVSGLVTAQISFKITGYTSGTVVTGTPEGPVPAWAQGVALTTWGIAQTVFSNLGKLQGQNISLLGDGNVLANPLNPALPVVTVSSGGGFTTPTPVLVLTAGLPIQMDVQTMPLENAQGETISDKRVTVHECYPIFYTSRGGQYGQDQYHLRTWKQPLTQYPNPVVLGLPVAPWTGASLAIPIQGAPQLTGQLWVRQTDPVPWGMSAVVLQADVGED